MKEKRNFAFVVELLLLFGILLFVIVVIVQVVAKTRSESLYAKHLTESVCLATDTAEILEASADREEGFRLLSKMERVTESEEKEEEILLTVRTEENTGDWYRIRVQTEEQKTDSASLLTGHIRVYFETEQEPVYELKTASMRR